MGYGLPVGSTFVLDFLSSYLIDKLSLLRPLCWHFYGVEIISYVRLLSSPECVWDRM